MCQPSSIFLICRSFKVRLSVQDFFIPGSYASFLFWLNWSCLNVDDANVFCAGHYGEPDDDGEGGPGQLLQDNRLQATQVNFKSFHAYAKNPHNTEFRRLHMWKICNFFGCIKSALTVAVEYFGWE